MSTTRTSRLLRDRAVVHEVDGIGLPNKDGKEATVVLTVITIIIEPIFAMKIGNVILAAAMATSPDIVEETLVDIYFSLN